MEADALRSLYSENRMFEGKSIKFFVDPQDIKKNTYEEKMAPGEEIIFGIKKAFEFHLMTDKAFYYTASPNRISPGGATKRIEHSGIMEWDVDHCLRINGDAIVLGVPGNKQEKAFVQSLRNIFFGIAGDGKPNMRESAAKRPVDPQMVWQLYQNHRYTGGRKLKDFTDANEMKGKETSRYAKVWHNGETALFLLTRNMCKHIMTDKAFYYENSHYEKKRVAFEDIACCEVDLAKGRLMLNDDIINMDEIKSAEDSELMYSIKSIFFGIMDLVTDFSSLPPLRFDHTVSEAEGWLTKVFSEKLTAEDIANAYGLYRAVYDGKLWARTFELERNNKLAVEPFMGLDPNSEKLMFKYDTGTMGFFVTDRRFGMYSGGRSVWSAFRYRRSTALRLVTTSEKYILQSTAIKTKRWKLTGSTCQHSRGCSFLCAF